ncbi:MAG: carboxypeptidase regulatory-like domain-containing protein [Flavobacterium sp.]|nr:carboxypeptidase regulatory-like domain-containing protein [Flavobacterium sp.]
MKNNKLVFSFAFMLILFFGCQSENDVEQQSVAEFQENFGQSVSRDFIGYVVDTNNNPIQNATISIGTSTVQTDVNGLFILNNADVFERFAYIKASKSGFIDGSRAMIPTSGKNNVRIMLLSNAPIATITSGSASEVALNSETKVNFDGAFQDANGNPYSGNVSVSVYHLKPSNDNIEKIMPGMLYGATESGEEAILQTYGMLNVELKGTSGQKLQIANGHTAQITMQIDNSQISTAPSTIPLWHFDEENGYWIQQGNATKVGNQYVGNVTHFSWWNCDAFSATVDLNLTVKDSSGGFLSNAKLKLTVNSTNFSSFLFYTSDDGLASGVVPVNEVITLKAYNICGVEIYSTQIGPFSQKTNLEVILPNSVDESVKVKGKILKCNNEIVTNGYVVMRLGNNLIFSSINDGDYEFNTYSCLSINQFTIEGFDFDTFQSTGKTTYNMSHPLTNINTLKACNSIVEYVSFKINGEDTIITENIDSQNNLGIVTYGNNLFANQLTIYANAGNPSNSNYSLIMECASNQLGSYTTSNSSFRIQQYFSPFNHFTFVNGLTYTSGYKFKINKFGNIGDYIDVEFSGTTITTQTYNITGIAHVIRDH